MKFKHKLGIIGFGNMASAIVNGVVSSNTIPTIEIAVTDRNDYKIERAREFKVATYKSPKEIVQNCEYILFAIKPQGLDDLAKDISCVMSSDNKIISILAGSTISKFHTLFPNIKVLRVMPNTPALVSLGMSALSTDDSTEDMINFGKKIFESVGEVILIKENQINNVIAVSGSGPAYVYEFMSAMYNKAISLNFDEETAKKLVFQTVKGSAEMFKQSNESLKDLCDKVCSKGGTTIEAVKYFRNSDFEKTIDCAMQACLDRATELSK